MSFKFDQEYVDWIKSHKETEPEFGPFVSATDEFIAWMQGHALCDCGAGCRDTAADNVAKLCAIAKAMKSGLSQLSLDALAVKDPKAFLTDLHEESWEEAKSRRASKD